jgi:hypothetical protein
MYFLLVPFLRWGGKYTVLAGKHKALPVARCSKRTLQVVHSNATILLGLAIQFREVRSHQIFASLKEWYRLNSHKGGWLPLERINNSLHEKRELLFKQLPFFVISV